MKGSSIIAATALSSAAQAAFIPETNFTLSVTQPGSDEASPVVVGCDGVLVTDPSNDNVFVGTTLPDGRIRIGGHNDFTWLTFTDRKELAQVESPLVSTKFQFSEDNFLKYQDSEDFYILLQGNGLATIYSPTAKFVGLSSTTHAKLKISWAK